MNRRGSRAVPARAVLGAVLSIAALRCAPAPTDAAAPGWSELEPGLELGVFQAVRPPDLGDGRIRVLRADLRRFALRLFNASAPEHGQRLTAREWCARHGLVAAINASMYQEDYRTSVSLMRAPGHVNNARLTRDKAVLAFDPLEAGLAPARIIDLECEAFEDWRGRYGTMIQSIRMLSCRGENVWSPQPGRWSVAAIGVDGDGRVLFIHTRSAYSVHDLIDEIAALPLSLGGLMYAEGGRQAQLHVRGPDRTYDFVGGPGAEAGDDYAAWPVPNVVGLVRR